MKATWSVTAEELEQARREATFVMNAAPRDAEGKPFGNGNSNQGHEFGVDLPQADKDALLEFLKGFGGSRRRPIVFGKK